MNTNDREVARRIAEVNDSFRTGPDLSLAFSARVREKFTQYDGVSLTYGLLCRIVSHEFPENTVAPAHDFAYLMCGGVEVWWKIIGQPGRDPSDPRTFRRLMVFMPDEYGHIESEYRGWV